MKHLTWLLLGSALLLSAACSDDAPPPPDPDAAPIVDADPNAPDAPPPTYSHDVDIQPIWTANCAQCHVFFSDAYANIVGAPSAHPTMNRIEPGDPDNSYIWHKINNTHLANGGAGTQMPPPPIAPLDQPTLDMINTWIMEGAPR